MKIAIIDGVNQDIGLNILFPEADYFIQSLDNNINFNKYNILPKYNWDIINDKNYDYLFIIISLYDTRKDRKFFKQDIYDILQTQLSIINNNNFKRVFIFDNYDYDYDPNEIVKNKKIDLFFKRNYNKEKKYQDNVIPFPFIMFGQTSIIEKIESKRLENDKRKNRIFFTGTLFTHIDNELNYIRNRKSIYKKIKKYLYNPGRLNYNSFLEEIYHSKFSLDLNGVGDPNMRTFEILSQGSLRISEYNELKWPFEEEFSKETIFKDSDEFKRKIKNLKEDDNLYQKCLDNQNKIFIKYFNKEYLINIILKYIYE